MATDPEHAPDGAPVPGGPGRTTGQGGSPHPRRRGPRRATGGTFTGPEPRLPGLAGRADEESPDAAGERAHEQWLKAQRPPHWD
ncbi:hypothetical protein GCM10009767_25930 [Kocuria aegyptia]|uniref:Uncharacterized protein n=1 Tax=Kocuria aegyptia TaxID=330943 RepID=A0ABP4X2B8_9MICC